MRANASDSSAGRFVVAVSPVFPQVFVDDDPEFKAIHQRIANAAVAAAFVRFLQEVLVQRRLAQQYVTMAHAAANIVVDGSGGGGGGGGGGGSGSGNGSGSSSGGGSHPVLFDASLAQ